MSRSGYSDACEGWALIRWQGAVASATRGKRGQAFLKELLTSLDAMPVKELIAQALEVDGAYCTLGVVMAGKGLPLECEDYDYVAGQLGVAEALVREIMYHNDEGGSRYEDPATRWVRMRRWVQGLIAWE